jgi:phosphoribosyl-ATP pyrophosphohydrolase
VGEVAVIDLDAALGRGDNRAVITSLLPLARCRVGGGIRSAEAALSWLDAGAHKVILGTRAVPEVLRELPRDRVIAALDAVEDEVVVDGWRTKTGERIADRIRALSEWVGGFLVTFVEREGRLGGTRLDRAAELAQIAGPGRLTIAGGVTTAEDIQQLDRLGADAQVGMALYTGRLSLAEAVTAALRSPPPWPTVIADRRGLAAGFGRSSPEDVAAALEDPEVLALIPDREREALLLVTQAAQHDFAPPAGLARLEATLTARRIEAPAGSYTRRLFEDPALLSAKLREEAAELAAASGRAAVIHEAADVTFFTAVSLARAGAGWAEVEAELDRRAQKVHRRPGDAKPTPEEP